jgi:SAM-dependent methyltransferase
MTDNKQWFEKPELWEGLRPYVFPPAKWEAASEEIDNLVELLDLSEGARVLDLPCGPGRHTVELARRGFDVTGVDITEAYIEEARELAEDEGLDAEFVVADMRDFRREAEFDVVLNLFSSFGYFEDPADDRVALDRMRDSLKPDGRVVFEMVAKETLLETFSRRAWHEFDDGAILLEDRRVSDDWGSIHNRWIVIDADGERTEFELEHRLFAASELRRLVESAGFGDVSVYGGLDGRAFEAGRSRLVLVASV